MALYNVLFDIAARTAKFEEGMTRVDRRLEGLQRNASKITKNLAGAFATGFIARFVAQTAAAGDEMLALAQRTGRTVESVSQLSHVAARGNTTVEALTKAQDQLAKRLGATDEEGKAAAKALTELGLSAGKIRAMGFDQRLDAIADAMGSITDPTQRARLEIALLGKTGTELDQVLRGGADGIRALREEADRLGITVTQLEAERLAKLDDQIENLKGQWGKLSKELVAFISIPVAPYLEMVSKGLSGWRVLLGLTGNEMEELNDSASRLIALRDTLIRQQEAGDNSVATMNRIAAIKEELGLIAERQDYLLSEARAKARYEAMDADNRAKAAARAEAAAKKAADEAAAAKKAAEAYAELRAELAAVAEQNKNLNLLELKFPTALLDKDDLQRELERTGSMVEEHAEKNEKTFDAMYKKMADRFSIRANEITIAAEQMARNVQTHLADFLFDPFDKGIRGMLAGFVDVMRRMVAEAAAAQILKGLGGFLVGSGNSFLSALGSTFIAPSRDSGGRGQPGRAHFIGTGAQPELYVPDSPGTFYPRGQYPGGGAVTYAPVFHISVDSRTDRAAVRQDVLAISSEVTRKGLEQFRDYMSRGGR